MLGEEMDQSKALAESLQRLHTKYDTLQDHHTLQKNTHPRHFGPNEIFFCHTYDTSMTIIVTKPGIIIDVVGPTSMTKNHDRKWAFRPGRAGDELHDILWAVHDGKTMVEARVRKISGSSQLRWEVGGRVMRVSLVHVRAWV